MTSNNLIPARTDDGENVQEDIDDVQVQCERAENVLFWAYGVFVGAAHHHLCIVWKAQKNCLQLDKFYVTRVASLILTNQIDTEQKGAAARINQCDGAASGEHGDKPEQHEQKHKDKQNAAHHGEIPLGLEGENGQSEAHSRGDSYSH